MAEIVWEPSRQPRAAGSALRHHDGMAGPEEADRAATGLVRIRRYAVRACPENTMPGRFFSFGRLPECEEMTFMKRYLRPGGGFIDDGANEGTCTLPAGQLVGPSGAVHAFEAVPACAKRLQDNAGVNSPHGVTAQASPARRRVGLGPDA
ncbi:hypothetical protein [Streptomyces sp. NPDC002587]